MEIFPLPVPLKAIAPIPLDWNEDDDPSSDSPFCKTETDSFDTAIPLGRDNTERDHNLILVLLECLSRLEHLVVSSGSSLLFAGEISNALERFRQLEPKESKRILVRLTDQVIDTIASKSRSDLSVESPEVSNFTTNNDFPWPERRIGSPVSFLDGERGEK